MHLARESIDLGSGYGVGDYDGYDDDEAPLLKHISRVNDRMKSFRIAIDQVRTSHGGEGGEGHTPFWLTQPQELELVEKKHGPGSWQRALVHLLHARRLEVFLLVLLLIDVTVVVGELFLEAQHPPCHVVVKNCISCCNASSDHRQLSSPALHSAASAHCEAPWRDSPLQTAACDPHKHPLLHTLHAVLFGTSVSILCIFMLELASLCACMGCAFFRNPYYILDSVIVVASLSLELVLHALKDGSERDLAGLLIFTRCWRFMRIGHGIFVTTTKADEEALERLEEKHCHLLEELCSLEATATELRMGQLPTSLARRGLALPNGLGAHAAVEGQRTLDVSIE